MSEFKLLVFIFIGSGFGGVIRFFLQKNLNYINQYVPFGTLGANLIASYVLGLVFELSLQHSYISNNQKLFWIVGICGGLSTFSTFTFEFFQLLEKNNFFMAIIYLLSHVLGALIFLILGMASIKYLA